MVLSVDELISNPNTASFWMKHAMALRLLNSVERLYSDLLRNYIKGVRPGVESNCSLNVNISLTVCALLNINSVEKTMAVSGFLTMFWRDERLKWNVTEYDGHSSLLIDPSLLWTPRIVLINPAKQFHMFGSYSTEVRVYFDGSMVWSAGDLMETNCKINIRYYPFDIQTCDISIAPWGYFESEVNQSTSFSTQFKDFPLGNDEWDLVKLTNVDWVSEGYKASNFTLRYKRKYQFVLINILSPIIVLNIINMAVFEIPPNSGERISFSVTVLLSYVVFLTIVMDNIPQTSSPVSLLSVLLMIQIILSACITMETVFIVKVSHRSPSIPISNWVVNLMHKTRKIQPEQETSAEPVENVLERVKLPEQKSRNASIESNDNVCSLNTGPSFTRSKKPTWEEVAACLDRIMFFIFLFVALLFEVLVIAFIFIYI
ncbi:hypothetical protein CHS0354_030969 [Potamilus streckersoni]|uniref:Uncharacterized protein n=1 Tax=Potamilus streckersoni TaxID=2493646 RepID=A0AAE0SFI2_9BIVA|nr:hypothetical protein CHS0354_030969 [Potamilus streckersoni]